MVEPSASDEATAGRAASEFTRRGGPYPNLTAEWILRQATGNREVETVAKLSRDFLRRSHISYRMALPTVIYEDEVLLAFDKPSGQLVAPDRRDRTGEDLMALVHARFGSGTANVHRLDAETSGVLLCAKTKPALDFLSGQFQAKAADRIYHALTAGVAVQEAFTVELALAEDEGRPGLMRIVKRSGRPSATRFQVLERFRAFTWLECHPLTGRTHQIRVHLAASGLPILNDGLYGNGAQLLLSALKRGYKGRASERPLISRLALHASELTVTHPVTHKCVTLRAPLPNEFTVALKYLRCFAAG